MQKHRVILLFLLFAAGSTVSVAFPQDIDLQPKYGLAPKNDAQKTADAKFLESMDNEYKGNRKKAAEDMSARGWQFLGQRDTADAMRRFNQAWLLDNSNGSALWGMAVVQAISEKFDESFKLFAEAERSVGDNLNFSVDYAKTLGLAGAQTRNDTILNDAFARFGRIHEKAPQHPLNLQNWAMTLFLAGKYTEAWEKVKLAEATAGAELDPRFLAALQSKMPRP